MPSKALIFCKHPGCEELVASGSYCDKHKSDYEERQKERKAKFDRTRESAAKRGYDARWQRARETYLKRHTLCVECMSEGKLTPATVVDHIIPHKGDSKLFWDKTNWQPLCKRHHDIKTAKEDGRWG